MPIDYVNLFALVSVAVVAPLLMDLLRLPVPDAVAMILIGIAVGSSGLGWIRLDSTVELLGSLGLAYLLFVAGMEVRLDVLRGNALVTGLVAFVLSVGIAVGLAVALYATGLIINVGVIVATLLTTSLGIVVVVLKDTGMLNTPMGQLTLLGGLLGDFTSVALISVIAPADGATLGSTLRGLAIFCVGDPRLVRRRRRGVGDQRPGRAERRRRRDPHQGGGRGVRPAGTDLLRHDRRDVRSWRAGRQRCRPRPGADPAGGDGGHPGAADAAVRPDAHQA
ncbi:MAG: cation:proton antiporter [Pseudonocardiales bacterium]|nr:cation:proton antiporter [Pseudonocardiales bacterium]